MPNSMEKNKNESIAAKELEEEEEEMKRELLDMGMYESGYTYKEMKDILGFISESKNMANLNNDSKNVQKDSLHSSNECATEPVHKTNLMQELDVQEHSNTNRLTHMYRPNRSSPILDRISTHEPSSPETTSILDSRSLTHRRKSSDSDDMFERIHNNQLIRDICPNSANRYSLRSRNSIHESQSSHAAESKVDTQSEQSVKYERWRINPLDSCTSENDVPLHQPERPLAEDREPFKLCNDTESSEVLEKVLTALNLHLKETADLWHSWHRTTDYKFQWGSPIQVGTANGSLDKKQISQAKTESATTNSTAKTFDERANKRKFVSTVTTHLLLSSDEEEDEAEFVSLKKKKVQSHEKRNSSSRHKKKQTANVSNNEVNAAQNKVLEDKISSSPCRIKTAQKLDVKGQEQDTSNCDKNSRNRIKNLCYDPLDSSKEVDHEPSHVEIQSISDSLSNNGDDQTLEKSVQGKKTTALRDDEILLELDKDSNEENIESSTKQGIKPLPMKRLSVRLERSCALLKKLQMEGQRKKEAELEEARKKEEEERSKMQEVMKQRAEEMHKKFAQREKAQKLEKEKTLKWNNVLQIKNKENRERFKTAQDQDVRQLKITESDRTRPQFSGETNEEDKDTEDLIECVPCPICNRSFPTTRIEMHAASCEQFNSDDEDTADIVPTRVEYSRKCKTDASTLECNICSKFRTSNGIDYEDHVNSCLLRKQREAESEPHGCTTVDLRQIPDSPIRCFRPISEQNDSEIDYRGQFASTSRAQATRGRKRKR